MSRKIKPPERCPLFGRSSRSTRSKRILTLILPHATAHLWTRGYKVGDAPPADGRHAVARSELVLKHGRCVWIAEEWYSTPKSQARVRQHPVPVSYQVGSLREVPAAKHW